MNIPPTHPRLWFSNPTRLQQARDYFATRPFTPTSHYQAALRSVLTGRTDDCETAARYMAAWQASPGPGGFRDDVRQQGEDLLLIFDWCFASFTPDERTTLVDRWNGYMDRELADDIGNASDEANNYWWGRTRNLLMWGIATHGINPRAQEFIDEALDERFGRQFGDWYGHFGRGGVFVEGSTYGVVSLSYPIIPFASAADFGYDPYAHTPFFREAIYALIYGSTPGPSAITGYPINKVSLFPFSDDDLLQNGEVIHARTYLGDFIRFMASRSAPSNARHARGWSALTDAGRRWLFEALDSGAGTGDFAGLPLDYYAPGAQVVDARTSHAADATQVHLQLGTPGGIEHRHWDAGSFQLWRKGRWMTRETNGYSDDIVAYGEPSGSAVVVDTGEAPAHNTLLLQGRTTGVWIGAGPEYIPPGGNPDADQPRSLPDVKRLQHSEQFLFVATDYSGAYRNGLDTRADWPYADKVWREFVFIRPMQALVALDRIRASSDSLRPFYLGPNWLWDGPHVSASSVVRSFITHFETAPVIAGNRITALVGAQTSELVTLLPRVPDFRVVDETPPREPGDPAPYPLRQFRVELDDAGNAESYFLNVLTGYDAGEPHLSASLTEDGGHWYLDISHPLRGSAHLVFAKGMDSHGGSISIDGGSAAPFREDVQGIHVTDEGPMWDGDSSVDRIFADGYEQ
ncbi:hypothetical protein [Dokdonella sp.]|uniref:hypothetical protein n=1 Tax=Dokdonella sp. TaxID=2291710 RepID=UPI002F40445D